MNLRLVTLPGVFQPISDSRFLADVLREQTLPPRASALDLCTGSGILAITAARAARAASTAVDVCRRALADGPLNARRNRLQRAARCAATCSAASPASASTRSSPTRRTSRARTTSSPTRGPAARVGRRPRRPAHPRPHHRQAPTRTCAPAASSCSPTRRCSASSARSPTSSDAGLEAECIARRRGPLGPLMTARVRGLEAQGLLAARPAPRGRRRHPRPQAARTSRGRRARPPTAAPAPLRPSARAATCSLSCSITAGSRSVVTSPSSRPSAMSRSSRRMILPERVLGRSSAQMIRFGRASLPIRSATCSRIVGDELVVAVAVALERHERRDRLAGVLVGLADDRRLGDQRVRHDRRLDLRRRHAVARDVDDVVDAPDDRDVAVLVDARRVADDVRLLARASKYVSMKRSSSRYSVRSIDGHGRSRTSRPCSSGLDVVALLVDDVARRRPAAAVPAMPGFIACAPGSVVIMIAPVSVCHHVSTTGHVSPPPMTSRYHSHAFGLIGSPTVPSRRSVDRSCFVGVLLAPLDARADRRRRGVEDRHAVALARAPTRCPCPGSPGRPRT